MARTKKPAVKAGEHPPQPPKSKTHRNNPHLDAGENPPPVILEDNSHVQAVFRRTRSGKHLLQTSVTSHPSSSTSLSKQPPPENPNPPPEKQPPPEKPNNPSHGTTQCREPFFHSKKTSGTGIRLSSFAGRPRFDLNVSFDPNEDEEGDSDETMDTEDDSGDGQPRNATEEDWADEELAAADRGEPLGDTGLDEADNQPLTDDNEADLEMRDTGRISESEESSEAKRNRRRKGKGVAGSSGTKEQVYTSQNPYLDGMVASDSSDDEFVIRKEKNAQYISLLLDKDMAVHDPRSSNMWALVPMPSPQRQVSYIDSLMTQMHIDSGDECERPADTDDSYIETINVPFYLNSIPKQAKRKRSVRAAPKGTAVVGEKRPKKTKKSKVGETCLPRRITRQTTRIIEPDHSASRQQSDPDYDETNDLHSDSDESVTPVDGFSSQKAKQAFETMRTKHALAERGFDRTSVVELDFVRFVVENHKWDTMVVVLEAYNLTLVRTFYAEAAATKSPILNIRGVDVEFTAEAINRLFGLDPPETTAYEDLKKNATKEFLDNMLDGIAQKDTDWGFHANYMLRTFRQCNLVPNANVWMTFVLHSLHPSSHHSSLNVDRMVLLHCIMAGKTINPGKLMFNRMTYCAKRNQGGLYFPMLVCRLCQAAGVPEYTDDVIIRDGDEEPWRLGLKEVSRLRTAKTGGDMMTMVNKLWDQNQNLTETISRIKAKRKERVRRLTADKKQVEREKAELASGLAAERSKWMKERAEMEREISGLKLKIRQLEEAAVTNATALEQQSAGTQPTPPV